MRETFLTTIEQSQFNIMTFFIVGK